MIDLSDLTDAELRRLEALLDADPDPTLSAFDAKIRDAIDRARMDHVHESRARRRSTHDRLESNGVRIVKASACYCSRGLDHL